MAVDYLSALNSQGSGLNITQIVDSLVEAEVAPKRNLISNSQSKTELRISELATLKSNLDVFQKSTDSFDLSSAFAFSNSNSAAITVKKIDNQKLENFEATLNINALATRQTLVYSGYSAADTDLGDVDLSIAFGTVSSNTFTADADRSSLAVSLTSTNLTGLADELSKLDGVSAQVVKVSDGNYTLVVNSESGSGNALSITGHASINTSDYSSVQQVAAQDASFEYNGLTITRESNTVNDLIDGVSLELSAVTDSDVLISGVFDQANMMDAVKQFIQDYESLRKYLAAATLRGSSIAEPGLFAEDVNIRSILKQLSSVMRAPISGFTNSQIYLAEMGVYTNRDGSLSLDETTFKKFFSASAEAFKALDANKISADNPNLSVSVSNINAQTPGVFQFTYDAATQTAKLDQTPLTSTVSGDDTIFTSGAEGFDRFSIKVKTGSIPESSQINVGISLKQKVSSLLTSFLDKGGDIDKRSTQFSEDLGEAEASLTSLDDQQEIIRQRYVEQFTAMEQVVTKLKSTSEYITTIMKAWNKEDN